MNDKVVWDVVMTFDHVNGIEEEKVVVRTYEGMSRPLALVAGIMWSQTSAHVVRNGFYLTGVKAFAVNDI